MKTCNSMTDDQLVHRYEQGDDSAFDVLLERHQEKLFNYIFFVVHDKDTADDIFQETFVRAITYIRTHRYTSNGYFYAWLIRIAHNLIHDNFHQKELMPMVSHEFLDEQGDVEALDGKANVNALTNLIQIVRYAYKKNQKLLHLLQRTFMLEKI